MVMVQSAFTSENQNAIEVNMANKIVFLFLTFKFLIIFIHFILNKFAFVHVKQFCKTKKKQIIYASNGSIFF